MPSLTKLSAITFLKENRKFITTSSMVFVLSNLANALNYAFQILSANWLSSSDYTAFSSFNSLSFIFSCTSVIQFLTTKNIIETHGQASLNQKVLNSALKWSLLIAISLFFITVLLGQSILSRLNLSGMSSVFLFGLIALTGVLVFYASGIAQAAQSYIGLAMASVVATIFKLAFGFTFVKMMDMTYSGVLAATLVSNISVLYILYLFLRQSFSINLKEALSSKLKFELSTFKLILPLALTVNLINIFTIGDVYIMGFLFEKKEIAAYALASVIGKIALFLPGSVTSILYSKICHENIHEVKSHSSLVTVLAFNILVVGGFVSVLACLPDKIWPTIFGPQHIVDKDLIITVSLTMGILSIVNTFFTYFLAKSRSFFLLYSYIALAIFYIILRYLNIDSILHACRLMLSFATTLLVLVFCDLLLLSKAKQIPQREN